MKRMTMMAVALTAVLAVAGGAVIGGHLMAQGPGGRGAGRFGGPGGPGGPGDMERGRGPGGPGAGMGAVNPMMLRQLDLSDAQRDKVKEIMDSHRDEQKALGDKARAAHQALDATILASPLDESAIRGKAADIAAIDADMAVTSGRVYSEIFQILTTDQQTKLKKLQADRSERMANGPQGREGRR